MRSEKEIREEIKLIREDMSDCTFRKPCVECHDEKQRIRALKWVLEED